MGLREIIEEFKDPNSAKAQKAIQEEVERISNDLILLSERPEFGTYLQHLKDMREDIREYLTKAEKMKSVIALQAQYGLIHTLITQIESAKK